MSSSVEEKPQQSVEANLEELLRCPISLSAPSEYAVKLDTCEAIYAARSVSALLTEGKGVALCPLTRMTVTFGNVRGLNRFEKQVVALVSASVDPKEIAKEKAAFADLMFRKGGRENLLAAAELGHVLAMVELGYLELYTPHRRMMRRAGKVPENVQKALYWADKAFEASKRNMDAVFLQANALFAATQFKDAHEKFNVCYNGGYRRSVSACCMARIALITGKTAKASKWIARTFFEDDGWCDFVDAKNLVLGQILFCRQKFAQCLSLIEPYARTYSVAAFIVAAVKINRFKAPRCEGVNLMNALAVEHAYQPAMEFMVDYLENRKQPDLKDKNIKEILNKAVRTIGDPDELLALTRFSMAARTARP